MWSNLNDKSSTDQFRQFPPTANNYTITGLAPDYHLSVTMVAVTPNGEGIVSPPILIYPLGNGERSVYFTCLCFCMCSVFL